MTVRRYLVSYELLESRCEYGRLFQALGELGAVCVLGSQWTLRDVRSPTPLRDHLRAFVGENDRLLVTELTETWAGHNVLESPGVVQPWRPVGPWRQERK